MQLIGPTRLAVLLSFATGAACGGQNAAVDRWLSAVQITQAAISPDGRSLAWVVPEPVQTGSNLKRSVIFVADSPSFDPRRMAVGAGPAGYDEKEVAWSPDGRQIAFMADAEEKGQFQLYVAPAAGGTARRLTRVSGQLMRPKWSPDGKSIAILFMENVLRPVGLALAVIPESGEVSGDTYTQCILLVDVATGVSRHITPTRWFAFEYDWSRDSREIAYTAAPVPGDANWYDARLYAVEAGSGQIREIYRPKMQIAVPRWSPDGRTIAFIGGLMSDRGSTGGDIWTVAASGGAARDLTPGRGSSPGWIEWLPRSNKLLFTEWIHGGTAVSTLDTGDGRVETLWRGDEMIDAGTDKLGLSTAADGETSAVIRSSYSRAPEVWSGKTGAWTQRTRINAGLEAPWGRAENIDWTDDGLNVEGWLVYPAGFDPHRRYPMVVSVHGGPANQKTANWPTPNSFDFAVMSATGYFVLCPNPRGSYGQGEAFTAANRKDFGHGDFRDIMSGVDHVLKTQPVDPARVGVTGGSYGGFMTMWAVTQTHRFSAAVVTAGIADWQSYYGQNGIVEWMPPYFGTSVYEDPAVYAKSSPILFIRNVRTPTLIFVGSGDKECPPPQSYEFWNALKTLGVETKFVIYPGEGHGLRDPVHITDRIYRTMAWFDQHLK